MVTIRTSIWSKILRRKSLSADTIRSDLKRCLGLGDLIFMSIGAMAGSGLYVLAGTVAHSVAGPSVILSYIIAAVASSLSSVCYAEFAARIPIAGSAYQFTYLSMGELWAFLIGWNVLIEHIVSAAAVARSWSAYLDSATGHAVKHYLQAHTPMMGGGVIPDYPDLIAIAITLVATAVIISGATISSKVTAGFVTVNVAVVGIIVGCGFHLGNFRNWSEVEGGFFPFGYSGTMSGAATLILSYVGYEVVASATEEAIKPSRDVPLSLFIGIISVAVLYVSATASLTFMIPHNEIVPSSAFPDAFKHYGWEWTRYLVTVGALAAMSSTLVSMLFPVPRYLLAMSRDGLLMKFFSVVNEKTQIPYISAAIGGVASIVFAITFELQLLIEFISIGQLLACTFVSLCVVKLRYEPNFITSYMERHPIYAENGEETRKCRSIDERSSLLSSFVKTEINDTPSMSQTDRKPSSSTTKNSVSAQTDENTCSDMHKHHVVGTVKCEIKDSKFGHLFLWSSRYAPGTVTKWLIAVATFSLAVVSAFICFTHDQITSWWSIASICIFGTLAILSMTLLLAFYQDDSIKTFKVPGVPFLPFVSAFVNIVLMMRLPPMTWLRLAIWIAIGLIIYVAYGYSHSAERRVEEDAQS